MHRTEKASNRPKPDGHPDFLNVCYAAEAGGDITFATFRLRPVADVRVSDNLRSIPGMESPSRVSALDKHGRQKNLLLRWK